ncbi:hypothetical protein C8R44DRAFT_880481 [Mycena epipterygia]|nr:hypothetical protein C8R44DRAFT_880481 [Mycena epipterygia]
MEQQLEGGPHRRAHHLSRAAPRRALVVKGIAPSVAFPSPLLDKIHQGALEYVRFEPGALTLSFLTPQSADAFVRTHLSSRDRLRAFTTIDSNADANADADNPTQTPFVDPDNAFASIPADAPSASPTVSFDPLLPESDIAPLSWLPGPLPTPPSWAWLSTPALPRATAALISALGASRALVVSGARSAAGNRPYPYADAGELARFGAVEDVWGFSGGSVVVRFCELAAAIRAREELRADPLLRYWTFRFFPDWCELSEEDRAWLRDVAAGREQCSS